MTEHNCENCRYWAPYFDLRDGIEGFGTCHRHAPRPFTWHSQQGDGHGYQPESLWPLTYHRTWCGEFKERYD